MTRTARYKLQYAIVLIAGLMLVGVAAWSLRAHPYALLGLVALVLVPGRLSGFLWRDLYRGRRLLEAGDPEASLESTRRFIGLLGERPRLRGLWWLAWAIYSRDPMAMALNNVGAAKLELGRFDEAESALREAIAVDPKYPIPHFNLAVVSTVRGESSTAGEHASMAVELGYARDAGDRVVHASSALLARIEGRGPAAQLASNGTSSTRAIPRSPMRDRGWTPASRSEKRHAVSKLHRVPDSLLQAENRDVLAFLQGKSAHSDVADALLRAAAPLGDVQSFCPDLAGYGYVLLSTRGIVFAFAVGMDQVGVRLDDEYKRRALETGGRDALEVGPDWASFQSFRSDFPAVDLPFWTRKAYAIARGADPS